MQNNLHNLIVLTDSFKPNEAAYYNQFLELFVDAQYIKRSQAIESLKESNGQCSGVIAGSKELDLLDIRQSLTKPWVPFAIFSAEPIQSQFGCRVFNRVDIEVLDHYFSSQIKPSILVIEDKESYRDVFKFALQDTYHVDTADSGVTGLKAFKTKKYDLVITDYMMPEMAGDEFLIKAREHDKTTPIMVMTAFDSKELSDLFQNLGVSDYTTKEFSIHDIRRMVIELLSRQIGPNVSETNSEEENSAQWKEWAESFGDLKT